MPATQGSNTHYESIPPSSNAAFVINTSQYTQAHRSAANAPSPSAQGTPTGSGSAVSVVNSNYALANPA